MNRIRKTGEWCLQKTFFVCALISVLSVILMSVFIFQRGLPLFTVVSPGEFLFSTNWSPTAADPGYGIFSFITGSFYVTFLALLIAVPVGICSGIFLSEMADKKIRSFLRSAVELLAGIPSVIYGLFGIAFIVPAVRNMFGGSGYSVLSASVILAIMTLPTIIKMTK